MMILHKRFMIGIILFFGSVGLYLSSSAPTVAPYRDAGEMATICSSLSVAHPPGYPLYAVVGKSWIESIPWANRAYRLNILSAVCMGFSVLLVFLILCDLFPERNRLLLAGMSFLFGTGSVFWYLATVSEMYSPNVCACLVLMLISIKTFHSGSLRLLMLAAFLFGLFVGIRMDLVLAAPAVMILGLPVLRQHNNEIPKISLYESAFFLLGFSIYFFLLIRSQTAPLINWGKPDSFSELWAVISRKTHGHTLDLLSKNYETGALFLPEMWIYVKHLFWEFTPVGFIGIGIGLYGWFKSNRYIASALCAGFIITGPVFIFLGNMPPNPHALAIMEPHYLLPDIFAFLGAAGILALVPVRSTQGLALVVIGCIIFNLYNFRARHAMRNNYFAYDYARNVLRTLPEQSIGVIKEDVQLFSLWYLQYIKKRRSYVPIVAQGLSGSSWYQELCAKRYPEIQIGPLRNYDDWRAFIMANSLRDICAGNDAELPNEIRGHARPYGLLNYISYGSVQQNDRYTPEHSALLLKHIYVKRGMYRYEYQIDRMRNFFNADLIEDYSASYRRIAYLFLENNLFEQSRTAFMQSIYSKRNFPTSYYHLGFLYFNHDKRDESLAMYELACRYYEIYTRQALQYHAFSSVIGQIRHEYAEACLHRGVVLEKKGRIDEAINSFAKAIDLNPSFSMAYFNLASVYWKSKNWAAVIENLERAVSLEPQNQKFRQFLDLARAKQAGMQ
ncbi:MAG: DUF2723 domain-containing protein [Elusimicrobia bacterium]|nr:DUF2723 domain-containing protein [Elusimicrobiota bacterium]MBD3412764.1 DUF2723 domain-containing protein [Elusimicrobiota bacterium]